MFNKDLEEIKKSQYIMNNAINELEDRIKEITTKEQNKEKRMIRIDESLRDLWVNIIHTSIRIIEVPEEEKVYQKIRRNGFPTGTFGKESACQCRRCKRDRFNPWVGEIPWRRKWQLTPVFLLGKSHGQMSLVGSSP